MDPFSYGYNRATPDDEYMNATALVRQLVDIVAKNGNLLLNVGPRADGTIPRVEVDNLREAGKWIHAHEEAIFNTTYWFRRAEVRNEDSDVRFTQTAEALYILSLRKPAGGRLVVEAPLPIMLGDDVSFMSAGDLVDVEWSFDGTSLSLVVDEDIVEQEAYCWVFKISYLV